LINKNIHVKYISEPYPVWVIDNFLQTEVLKKIQKEWPDSNSNVWHGGHSYINNEKNILEQGMLSLDRLEDMPQHIAELVKKIHTDEFTQKISKITGVEDLITDFSRRWSGVRVMCKDSFQAIHSDARRNPETGYRKELTCLVYFNKNWKKEDVGQFEVWDDDMNNCVHKIEPIENRLVIFLNTDKSYHGVPEVKSERRSITWSLLKDGDSDDRSKALFVARPNDDEKINELGRQRAYIKDNNYDKGEM
tara:strand:- start:353 stop:1099 length:747 start_codon:yes stop_codon:yes gene_type:complete